MDSDIKLDGIEKLLNKIEYMMSPSEQNKAISKALKAGAEIIKVKVKPKIPVSKSNPPYGHAADNIFVSGLKRKDGVPYVTVGPDKGRVNKHFYLNFLEWGTIHIPAKAMFGRTLAEERVNVKEAIIKELKEGLGL
ncbi:MAG: HK97-gp10 family putative phage morphogenesis protein [Clostridia bacterium]|jgi:HK97 gp10 family phage protein